MGSNSATSNTNRGINGIKSITLVKNTIHLQAYVTISSVPGSLPFQL